MYKVMQQEDWQGDIKLTNILSINKCKQNMRKRVHTQYRLSIRGIMYKPTFPKYIAGVI